MSTCDCFKGIPAGVADFAPRGSFGSIAELRVYTARPKIPRKAHILFLPDGFGLANHNLRLADMYAECGYETTIVDYFEGDSLPDFFMLYTPGTDLDSYDIFTAEQKDVIRKIDMPTWRGRHTPDHLSSLVNRFYSAYRDAVLAAEDSQDQTKIHVLGHCFGGKYALQLGQRDDVAISSILAFHPAFLQPSDPANMKKPLLVGCAESDAFTPSLLQDMLRQLPKCGTSFYKFLLYGGTKHGFSSRQDPDDRLATAMFKQAFGDSVQWMETIASA